MANYIVAYTINSDSTKGVGFSNFLKDIGLKEVVDQSTRYGCFEGTYCSLQARIKDGCKKFDFTKEDHVFLFSAGRNNNLTINKSTIN